MDRSPTEDTLPVVTTIGELVARARLLAGRGGRTLVGIVGPPGAGKSTVCEALDRGLGAAAVTVGMDGFHLDDEVLVALGRRGRKGAPDTFDVPGYVSLLRRLRNASEEITYAPRFDRSLEASRGSAVPVPRSVPLVITEGNYLLNREGGWQDVRPLLDEVWFLDVPSEKRVRRLVERRLSFGETPERARAWVTDVDEVNAAAVLAGRDFADIIVRLATASP